MKKTIIALLLAIGLLLGCLCGAKASSLTRAEMYEAYQAELHRYFDGDDYMPLEELTAGFESLGAYKKSAAFSYYTAILRDVEADSYGRIPMLLDWMRIDSAFGELLEEEGFASVDELEQYAQGRQAEDQGDAITAIACYRKAVSMPDSLMRIARLDSASLETQYQHALGLLRTAGQTAGGYATAADILSALAGRGYRDSAELLTEAQARLRICELQSAPPQRAANAVLMAEDYNEGGDYKIDIYSDGTCTISEHVGADRDVNIPATLYGYRVTAIGEQAFYMRGLNSVVIPEGVEHIHDNAFAFNSQMQAVSLPQTLRSIGNSAFQNCHQLKSLDLPAGIRFIGNHAFFKCLLTSVTIPGTVTSIGINPFQHCTSLREIIVDPYNQHYCIENHALMSRTGRLICYPGSGPATFRMPDSVTSIGDRALVGCATLVQIELSEEQSRLYRNPRGFLLDNNGTLLFAASAQALGVTDYVIPEGTRKLPIFTLHEDDQLVSIVIPEGMTVIENGCFWECPHLMSITLPRSLTSIGNNCFKTDNGRVFHVPEGSYAQQFVMKYGHNSTTY